jgi:hypothetical protein
MFRCRKHNQNVTQCPRWIGSPPSEVCPNCVSEANIPNAHGSIGGGGRKIRKNIEGRGTLLSFLILPLMNFPFLWRNGRDVVENCHFSILVLGCLLLEILRHRQEGKSIYWSKFLSFISKKGPEALIRPFPRPQNGYSPFIPQTLGRSWSRIPVCVSD